MRALLPMVVLAAVTACAGPTGTAPTVAARVTLTDGGEFVETERTAEFSIVEVRQAPAGSVASSMFALRGSCAVARSRGQPYFSSEPVPAGVRAFRLSFPRAPSPTELRGASKTVFSLADCSALGF